MKHIKKFNQVNEDLFMNDPKAGDTIAGWLNPKMRTFKLSTKEPINLTLKENEYNTLKMLLMKNGIKFESSELN